MRKIIFLLLFSLSFGVFAQKTELKELDLMLTDYKYPYKVNYINIYIQKHDYKMAYMDVKPANTNGRNVLLLHGKNFNGAYWETTAKALANEGFRVIIPDQIGFGKSSKPEYLQYSFHQLAQNTRQLLDSLQIKQIFVLGHSMGGMLASRFTLMYPEMTEKLVLENPIGLEDWKLVVPYKSVDWWYKKELKKDYEKIKSYQKESYYDGNWKPEYEEWVNILAGWTLNEDYEKISWNSALQYDMIFTQPVLYEFKHISCPTLLIIGTRDRTAIGKDLVSEEVKKTMGLYKNLGKVTRDKIPNAELAEIENVGHLPHIEKFEEFITPLIEFLKE